MATYGYKFLMPNMTSRHDGSKWEVGVWREASGKSDLGGPGCLHYYRDPLLAVLHDPIHSNYGSDGVLWKVEVSGKQKHDGWLKSGSTRMCIIKQVKRPRISLTQRVAHAILAAKKIHTNEIWNLWADRWLDGADRSEESARAAARVAPSTKYSTGGTR